MQLKWLKNVKLKVAHLLKHMPEVAIKVRCESHTHQCNRTGQLTNTTSTHNSQHHCNSMCWASSPCVAHGRQAMNDGTSTPHMKTLVTISPCFAPGLTLTLLSSNLARSLASSCSFRRFKIPVTAIWNKSSIFVALFALVSIYLHASWAKLTERVDDVLEPRTQDSAFGPEQVLHRIPRLVCCANRFCYLRLLSSQCWRPNASLDHPAIFQRAQRNLWQTNKSEIV